MLQTMGKAILVAGVCIAALGGVLYVLGRLGLGKLPGDLSFGGRNWRVYLPIGTCIILSIVLSLVLWVLYRMRR